MYTSTLRNLKAESNTGWLIVNPDLNFYPLIDPALKFCCSFPQQFSPIAHFFCNHIRHLRET